MKFLGKEQGFTGMDIMIAVIVVTLFTGLIVTLSYNIYLAVTSVDKISAANSYVVDVFEQAELEFYDNIDIEGQVLINKFNTKYEEKEVRAVELNGGEAVMNPFKVEIGVEPYIPPDESGLPNLDLVKTITVKVTYKIGKKEQVLEMTKVKTRETLEIPNIPDIGKLADEENIQEINKITPIKYVNGKWQVCDKKDVNWYNYNNGDWATVLASENELSLGTEISPNNLDDMGDVYFWVPRYSYDTATSKIILFEYGLSKKHVEIGEKVQGEGNKYQNLLEIPTSGYDSTLFGEDEKGKWISQTDADNATRKYKF